MFVLTKEGRVLDDSSFPVKELVNGSWVPCSEPVYLGTLMSGKVLSPEEGSQLERTGTGIPDPDPDRRDRIMTDEVKRWQKMYDREYEMERDVPRTSQGALAQLAGCD